MFTLPLYDDNPTRRTPVVTWMLIAACILVFLYQEALMPRAGQAFVFSYGVIPAVLFGDAALPPHLAAVPPWASIFTSMFLHGSWLHLGGNMLFLWIFGNNIEDSMGHGRFVAFYLLAGAAGALAQSLAAPHATVPMIGASGAIAGILGAYLVLHPRANVTVLVVILVFIRFIRVPAAIVLGLWFLVELASGAMTPADAGGVAFWAHVGGFVAGATLIPVFRDRSVPLFGHRRSRAFEAHRLHLGHRGSVPTVTRVPRHPPGGPWGRQRGPWGRQRGGRDRWV